MSKGLIALVILSVLTLLVIGCKAPAPGTPPLTGGETPETGKAAETGITGDIKEVDSLNNELNDPELEKTDSYLDEVNW